MCFGPAGLHVPSKELIETLWNVNVFARPIKELIETLWNVNTDIMYKKEDVHTELIETLWNVNYCS